jgi:hypothetical protein
MKEVFTKSFWKSVKKTFEDAQKGDEAREGQPAANKPLETPSAADTPSPPSVSNEPQPSPDFR